MPRCRPRTLVGPGLVLIALAGGCGRAARDAGPTDPPPVFAASAAAPDLSVPPVSHAESGAEAALLLATAPPQQLARTLAPYLDLLPRVSPESLATIEANGLRLVRLPLADWPKVAQGLRLTGAAQRLWLSDRGEWTELMRGPDRASGRGQVISLDAERLELGPGRLRLLGRCWLTPVPADEVDQGSRAELRLELLPQLQDPGTIARQRDEYLLEARATRPIDQGMTFPRLTVHLRAHREPDASWMYLLIAERPGVDWRQLASPARDDESADGESARPIPAVGQVVRSGDRTAGAAEDPNRVAAGPSAAALPTLGEALFGAIPAADAEPSQRTLARVVLALVPRAPAEFRLIAPASPGEPISPAPKAEQRR